MARYVAFGGIPIRETETGVFVRFLKRRLQRRISTVVCFANSNFIVKSRHLALELSKSPNIFVLNDGVAVAAAARIRYGRSFRENMNGTDFIPFLLCQLPVCTRVYLLGATADSVSGASSALEKLPNLSVVGFQDGFSMWSDDSAVERIRAATPDVLLVALGNPLQEEWILRNRNDLSAPLILGVGAMFDFWSGLKPRAPILFRKLRLEWAFRLSLEPRRLARRYTWDTAHFFAIALFSTPLRRTPR